MERKLVFMLLSCLLIFSCRTPRSGSQNSQGPDGWEGQYNGILPCADCEGIQTSLELKADGSYQLRQWYLGKSETAIRSEGKFSWQDNATVLRLESNGQKSLYKWREGKLLQLDQEGREITGNLASQYILEKGGSLTHTYWKLTELMGSPVQFHEGWRREPHLILHRAENRVTGHGGCNSFRGSYSLMQENRIQFSPMAATKMACPDMITEGSLFRALERVDSYVVKGDSLQLLRARMAPVARFVAVYLR